MLGIVGLAALPLLLLAALSAWGGAADVEARIVQERVVLARAAAFATTSFVEGNLLTLKSVALSSSVADRANHAELASLFERIRAADPNWDVLGLNDADGWNIAITGLPPRSVNVSSLELFRQVQATGRPFISSAFLGRVRGVPLVALAVPVDFVGDGRGVLSGSLSLDRLRDELAMLLEDSTIRVIVLDAQGQAFIHPDRQIAQTLTSLRGSPDVDAVLAGRTGSVRISEPDGAEMLSAYAPVPGAGWAILIQQPSAVAFDVVRRQLAVATALLASAAALAALIAWWLAGRLALFYQRQLEARTQAEAAARELRTVSAESERRRRFLEGLIASAPVAIAIVRGPEHRYVTVNQRYQAIKPHVPMPGRTLAEVFPEAAEQGPLERLDHVYRTGEQFTASDLQLDVADEHGQLQPRLFTLVLSRYDDAEGRPEGVLIVAVDTTEAVLARRRAERDKDEFLSIASHELKTPLTSLALAAQMIDRMLKRGPLDQPRLERHLGTIALQTARATQLIGDLLDVSRIETGQLELRRDAIDLVALVSAAVQRQRDALPDDGGYEIVETFDAAVSSIEGDEARLDQVVTNLLSNAVKYSPEGGRIDVRLDRVDGQVRLAVVDRGIGVAPDERERLFTPFVRTATARRRGIEGTGLGLYITRRIVEAHGGTIGVEETPGGGSTFVVTLPPSRGDRSQ